ncbi:MAG: DUF2818 family protein [Rhodocyclaceae bacterium]|jgi:hypothetical protein|nr:DUF2818 family protein [Rhodocyclaceae bacterium]
MTAAQIFLVIAGLLAANLPFLTQRSLAGIPCLKRDKALWLRLLELIVLYLLLGLLASVFERSAYGAAYAQGWEFYAITFCLFLVLAYPGFVYRYLWQGRKRA